MKPVLRHVANLWTLMGHPSPSHEWCLTDKLAAIKDAGFDGVCWAGSAELGDGCQRHGLIFVGGMATNDPGNFPRLLREQKDCGASHVNVHLGTDLTEGGEALQMAMELNRHARTLGVIAEMETHRGTCTETPEKFYALCHAYEQATGESLPVSLDFSHFAVVKHLLPEQFAERLLVNPTLIQGAQQFHFRPFNGHHAQVPVTDGKGGLSREFHEWLPFAEAVLKCWLQANGGINREILVCPELGPLTGGYALSAFPNSWDEAVILRNEIAKLWSRLA